jgi:hypothetical protein
VFVYRDKFYQFVSSRNQREGDDFLPDLLEAIFILIHDQFRGNINAACNYWGSLIVCLRENDYFLEIMQCHPQSVVPEFTLQKSGVSELPQWKFPTNSLKNPSYIYKIDLNKFSCSFCCTYLSDKYFNWSMKSLYRTLLNPHTQDENDILWYKEVHSIHQMLHDARHGSENKEKNSSLTVVCTAKQGFTEMYSVILIQSVIRCFIAFRRALQPGCGVLYVGAKRRFEECWC